MTDGTSTWTACARGNCPGHIDLSGSPGRCPECSFHVETQGHRDCCSQTAPVAPDHGWTQNFLENVRRRKAAAIPDEVWKYFGHRPPRRQPERPADNRRTDAPIVVAQPGGNPRYVAAAIRAELDRLASAHEGSRNTRLNEAAFAIFAFVKGGHADENASRAELERVALAIGLENREIHATLRSAWNTASPRDVPALRGAA
jgi:hypothetical protein